MTAFPPDNNILTFSLTHQQVSAPAARIHLAVAEKSECRQTMLLLV